MFQPVHGYDVRRELMSWHAEEWGNVAPGSIYNALKTLAREEMIEVVGTGQVGGRPERTTFRITQRGERDLQELINEQLWAVRMPVDPLVAVISVMGFVRRTDLIAALEARAAQIAGYVAHAEHAIATVDDIETPAHVREMLWLIDARMTAELGWSKAFVARLRAGEYVTADDPPWGERKAARAAKAKPKAAAKAAKPKPKPRARPRAKPGR